MSSFWSIEKKKKLDLTFGKDKFIEYFFKGYAIFYNLVSKVYLSVTEMSEQVKA